ncbi:MAG: trypsin-like peptidase domain-containing protein [Bacteroidia bacterium]|nr:trypsin-like peptidase domain-containing protein [Bacteroidia bacterium]
MDISVYEDIDSFLLGEMNEKQRMDFEKMMRENPELSKEVQIQKELIELINEHERTNILKEKLAQYHNEFFDKENLNNRYKRSVREKKNNVIYMVTLVTIAASISLLVTLGTLFFSGWFGDKQDALYQQLRNNLEDISTEQRNLKEIIAKSVKQPMPHYNGTGFVISQDGYIVTNYHVIKDVDSIFASNKTDSFICYRVKPVYTDISTDLAFLKVDDTNFVSFDKIPYTIKDRMADLGEQVYTLGYSKEDVVFGEGAISSVTGFCSDSTSYQITIPANPGISGAPLLDANGNILGLISGKHSRQESATFAIRAKYLIAVIDSINKDTTLTPVVFSKKTMFSNNKRTEQLKNILPFIFKIEIYKE